MKTKRLKKKVFSKTFGPCAHCGAPIWFNRIIDNTGTPLLTYHCWNGHYEAIDSQVLNLYKERAMPLSKEDIGRILPFIKFVKFSE